MPHPRPDDFTFLTLHVFSALAGASATIASDALMNPFDGASGLHFLRKYDQTVIRLQSSSNECRCTNPNFVA